MTVARMGIPERDFKGQFDHVLDGQTQMIRSCLRTKFEPSILDENYLKEKIYEIRINSVIFYHFNISIGYDDQL